ncbi:DUF6007 family protein [Staphylococcus hyicus]|uniref:DUF6007 family protein n=1 Tax=Staphylococcus hyicus TaxID=1284 RepID=UPI00211C4E4C|nr:DUF6007 family protein [Staphylococcus hyicus]MCQ9299531.1 DUF6007 family protein [Staphylococcus hyicus]
MRNKDQDNLDSALIEMGWLDLIFLIPMFLLFSYLPDDKPFSILINVLIVIFFGVGIAVTCHWLKERFKSK